MPVTRGSAMTCKAARLGRGYRAPTALEQTRGSFEGAPEGCKLQEHADPPLG
jgi:hypothetical protein